MPCANTTDTPYGICSGDGTNATSWNSQIHYSIPCIDCPYGCSGNYGECLDEPTCEAAAAIVGLLAAWMVAVMCIFGFFFCVLPLCAVCVCGVTICGFGLAAAQNRRQPVTTTVTHVGYVAAPEGYVPQPGYHQQQPVIAQGYAQPPAGYPPTGYPQPPPAYAEQPSNPYAGGNYNKV